MSSEQTGAAAAQRWSSDTYEDNVRFVSDLGAGVMEWLDPKPGERILDLGCGDGVLTIKLIESGADVIGADASEDFVQAARERGIDARLIDGHALTFEREFDAVFSNAALHWMTQPQAVIAGVARALKPGGRFVAEFGGFGNVAAFCTAVRAVGEAMGADTIDVPWFFPTENHYSGMLEAAGFSVERIVRFARPTPLPTGAHGWLEIMLAPFFDQFGERREEALDKVIGAVEPSLRDHTGQWFADYVRLRFAAKLSS
jgi:SAM-dependent methyltransferase